MALAERTPTVYWEGTLAKGGGSVRAGSGAVTDLPLDWASRSDRSDGKSSPEELLAAAEAACYAQSLAVLFARDGVEPQRIEVTATCALEEEGDWYRITAVDLEARVQAPGVDEDGFQRVEQEADERCPVTRALRGNVEVRVTGSLG
jgi:osmotically inducible protein OsmC